MRAESGLLAHRLFTWLLAGRTTVMIGNAVAPIALAFAVLDLTGSAVDLGLVVAARSLANVALLMLGGVLADRLPRRVLLSGSSLAAAGTQGVVAALILTGNATVPWLVALSILNGAAAAASLPAASALTPDTVPPVLLQSANAILRIGANGALVVGASAGGALVAAAGPGWGLVLDSMCFLLAAGLFAQVRVEGKSVPVSTTDGASAGILRDLRDGWVEVVQRPWLYVVVLQFAVVNAASVGAITVLGPLVADESFGRGPWGAILASQTLGLVVGGLVALKLRPHHPLRTGVALAAVTSLPAFALAVRPAVLVLMAVAFVAGAALTQFAVAWDLSLQQQIPGDRLARVYSLDAVGSLIAVPIGEAAVGPLAEGVGVRHTLIGCGSVIVLASGVALMNRSVRALTRSDVRV